MTNSVPEGSETPSPSTTIGALRDNGQRISWAGVAFGITAAVTYTISNACFRGASTKMDFVLCAAAKATITACLVLPWWLQKGRRGVKLFPKWPQSLWLVFAALQVQLLGGVMLQASLSTIGIALVVPIYLGAMVVATGLLSNFVLGEKINSAMTLGLAILVGSVVMLSLGAEQAHAGMASADQLGTSGLSFVGGIIAAVVVGLTYAVLAVIIRGVLKTSDISQQTPIIFVSVIGMILLGGWSVLRGGYDDLINASSESLWSLLGGGLFNAMGFFCLTMAIGLLPVIYVNAINISQAAMAAIIGVTLFAEAPSVFLYSGLVVMLVGFGIVSASRKKAALKQTHRLDSESGELADLQPASNKP